jgi:hypothetical protein
MATLELVKQYVAENQRLPPLGPEGYYKGAYVGKWLHNQSAGYSGQMTPEREAALNTIPGWSGVSCLDVKWLAKLEIVIQYVTEYHQLPPLGRDGVYKGFPAGRWLFNQLAGSTHMTPQRTAALETIPGWFWLSNDGNAMWYVALEHVKQYVAENQRLPPMRADMVYGEVYVGSWVHKHRTGNCLMTSERAAALETIPGWTWLSNDDAKWLATLELVKRYVAENKRLPPMGKKGFVDAVYVGGWVQNQRSGNGQMSRDRAVALETIPGWTWVPLPISPRAATQQAAKRNKRNPTDRSTDFTLNQPTGGENSILSNWLDKYRAACEPDAQ